MKRALRLIAALLASTALAGPVLAMESPAPIAQDEPRIRRVPYDPNALIRLVVPANGATAVVLAPDETGYKAVEAPGWKADNQANVLIVTAGAGAPPTDMHVIGRLPDGTVHTYTFLLVASPDDVAHVCAPPPSAGGMTTDAQEKASAEAKARNDAACPYATVRIDYTKENAAKAAADKAAAAKANWQARRNAWLASRHSAQQIAAQKIMAQDQAARRVRCDFEWRGSAALLPVAACDTGDTITLLWPGQMPIPAVFLVGPDGNETTSDAAPSPDRPGLIVVPRTSQWVRLRQGKLVTDLYNAAWNPIGNDFGTGTVSPRVRTELRADAGAGR